MEIFMNFPKPFLFVSIYMFVHVLKFIHYKINHKTKCYTYCAAYIVNLFRSQKTSQIFLFESPPIRIELKWIASRRKTRFCKTSNDVSSRDFPVPVSGQCSRRIFRDDLMLEKSPCEPTTRARTSTDRDLRSGPVSNMALTMARIRSGTERRRSDGSKCMAMDRRIIRKKKRKCFLEYAWIIEKEKKYITKNIILSYWGAQI